MAMFPVEELFCAAPDALGKGRTGASADALRVGKMTGLGARGEGVRTRPRTRGLTGR